jgi:hypothetical protein
MLKLHGINDLGWFTSDYSVNTFTDTPSVDMAVAVAAIKAPTPLTNVLYLTETGNSNPIAISDINQGQIGDCFLLSSIGEIARTDPTFIKNMIHQNANGTETVTLNLASTGATAGWSTTAFKTTSITVNNSTFLSDGVNSGATQDVLNGQKESWVQVLEDADATLHGGYGKISGGGYPVLAMEDLTGKAATYTTPQAFTVANLVQDIAANDLLVFDTLGTGTRTNGLYSSHAYMFDHTTGTGTNTMVYLDNPWGFAQPTAIAFSTLSKNFAEIDIGHVS